MKKQLLSIFAASSVFTAFAQLPVSTSPEQRKAIIEEYTGIHCQYCPQGHKIVDQIQAANPGNAFGINIHVGGYATPGSGEPDFRTAFGTALANQSMLTGYPAGSINRYVFGAYSQSPGGTAMSRGFFNSASGAIMNDVPSYVNVALQGTIDAVTRILTVNVEVYYTGNSPVATNFLNVAVIQDSILGPQTSGALYYPEKMVGALYQHDKVLRTLLTGQWGDQIATTTAGSMIAKQYTYTIPAQLPLSVSGGAIKTDVLLKKLRIIAFITETQQLIETGNTGPITIMSSSPSFSLYKTDAASVVTSTINNGNTVSEITNPSAVTVTKLKLKNNATVTQTFNVTRTIVSQSPVLDQSAAAVAPSTYFCYGNTCFGAPVSTPPSSDYTILLGAGLTSTVFPLADNSVDNNQPFSIDLEEGASVGTYVVKYKVFNVANANDTLAFFMSYNQALGIKNISNNSGMAFDVYPNPASSDATVFINSNNTSEVKLTVTNYVGQTVYNKQQKINSGVNNVSLDCKNLAAGIYFVMLESNNNIESKKLVITK